MSDGHELDTYGGPKVQNMTAKHNCKSENITTSVPVEKARNRLLTTTVADLINALSVCCVL